MDEQLPKNKTRDWDLIFTDSEYTVIGELIDLYESGEIQELGEVLKRYREKIKRSEERELYWKLNELMTQIILWKTSENFRTKENALKILDYRGEIDMDLEFNGCLTTDTIQNLWDEAFTYAREHAMIFDKNAANISPITWNEVFTIDY